MILGLVVDPVEAGFHRQLSQETVLVRVPVIGRDVHSPALVVQRAGRVVAVFIPGLGHSQVYARPLVHHSNSQPVQTVFASLGWDEMQGQGSQC